MSRSEYDVACLTVRLGAIAQNYRLLRDRAAGAVTAGVVKADGYGLGAGEATRTLLAQGCDTFFVARLEEGIALRPVAPKARIFVLDGPRAASAPAFVAHDLVPILNSQEQIEVWRRAARGHDAAVHIDTGLSRLGLPPSELSVLAAEARQGNHGFNLVLVMSHLACAEDPASPMNAEQLSRFRTALAQLPPAPASLASSGGILLGRDYIFDLVRPGIALFGGNPQTATPNLFAVAARLTGRVLQVRRVDKGDTVGYGATFRVERPTTLVTVALGYADGLMRALGNKGTGAIAGQKAPIVGRMSMDLVTLDATDIPPASVMPGAEIEFLGDTVRLEDVAAAANTAAYEILTLLGRRVRRVYEARS
ncbi:MAG TPA: alanine racemase [Rhizomicrobium sp.]|nr:alanine racemase [Rhizomicrobium sp.]